MINTWQSEIMNISLNIIEGMMYPLKKKKMHEIVFAKIEGPVDKQLILVLK